MKSLITLLIAACLFTSCKHTLSGRYEITAIGTTVGNDTVIAYLRKSLLNKQFDLTVDSNAVTMRSLATHSQIVLKRWNNAKFLTYLTRFSAGQGQFLTVLKRDTGFNMDVTLNVPDNVVLPVQNSTVEINSMFGRATGKYGRVECYLTKVSN